MDFEGKLPSAPDLISTPKDYFEELLTEALTKKKVKTLPVVSTYIVDLLSHYVCVGNLFDEETSGKKTRSTLAEMFLAAASCEPRRQIEILKKLGDQSLYISGFFGDSLQRKIVDVDYYVQMGCSAYGSLATVVRESHFSQVYTEMAHRFGAYVDVLTYISEKVMPTDSGNMMSLFDKYTKLGSEHARDQLIEKGVLTVPLDQVSVKKQ